MLLKNKSLDLVSIIIPTKNSEKTIGACIKSIKDQTYKNIEIIVVDNNSMDKTKEIVRNFSKINKQKTKTYLFNKGPERSAQRNYGAKQSKGEYLLFIDSDMELSKDVVKECIRQVESYKVSKVNKVLGGVVIPEESFGEGFWAKCKALERSFYVGVDWMEAARFFSIKVFNEFKGYDEELISGEDWDLDQRVKEKYKILRINSFISHNEGKLSLGNLFMKKMYYASKIKNYLLKNKKYSKKQASMFKRYVLFLSIPEKIIHNPIVWFGMLFMKTVEFIAGGLGFLTGKLNIK